MEINIVLKVTKKKQIKYLEKSLTVLFADQIIQLTIIATYKNKMKTYCLKCKKDTENIDPKVLRTKNNRLLMQSKRSDCKKRSHDL